MLPTQLSDLRTALGLLQNRDDLLFAKSCSREKFDLKKKNRNFCSARRMSDLTSNTIC